MPFLSFSKALSIKPPIVKDRGSYSRGQAENPATGNRYWSLGPPQGQEYTGYGLMCYYYITL